MTESSLRIQFFNYLFGDSRGQLCVAYATPFKTEFKTSFFQWPQQHLSLEAFIDQVSHGHNVWFATSLFSASKRVKENALPGRIVWADFDGPLPEDIDPIPSCIVQSSPAHHHAYWRLEEIVAAQAQEDYSRKMAYRYETADKGGWDLTQLLRIPYTHNYKPEYNFNGGPPMVEILKADDAFVPVEVFDLMFVPEEAYGNPATTTRPVPDLLSLPTKEEVIAKYISKVNASDSFTILYGTEPRQGDDWSAKIWRFVNLCFEIGMVAEEVFVVASSAKCNKYARDNRPISHLWKDVLKAEEQREQLSIRARLTPEDALSYPILVEEALVENEFLVQYRNYAGEATDAPEIYHELCAVIMLSAILAPHLQIRFKNDQLDPVIWGMILGGSTLTRKSTAKRMAQGILTQVDKDVILGSDASPEGLLTALSSRSDRTSIFLVDEVASFFKSVNEKPYMVNMPEILTGLYDVEEIYARQLRNDAIEVRRPHLILWFLGIKDIVYSRLTENYVTSGFIPRFFVVAGETTLENYRPRELERQVDVEKRQKIVDVLANLKERFTVQAQIVGGSIDAPKKVQVMPTVEAMNIWTQYERQFIEQAQKSAIPDLALPTFQRQSDSLFKLAMLFAAVNRDIEGNTLRLEKRDLIEAAVTCQKWGPHLVDLLLKAGKTVLDKDTDKAFDMIREQPGVSQREIYHKHKFRSKYGAEIIETLEARGLIRRVKEGKSVLLYPVLGEA